MRPRRRPPPRSARPVNAAPTVTAGADVAVTLPAGATLAGSVGDDGLPAGSTVAATWTKVSGPGSVTFADATAPSTTATFGAAGERRAHGDRGGRCGGDPAGRGDAGRVGRRRRPAGRLDGGGDVDEGQRARIRDVRRCDRAVDHRHVRRGR